MRVGRLRPEYRHILIIINIYCSDTATVVTQKHLIVTLCVLYVSRLNSRYVCHALAYRVGS
jgi:hypothetical protein